MTADRPNFGARAIARAQDIQHPHLREIFDIWSRAADQHVPHPETFDPLNFAESARYWLIYDITERCRDFTVRFVGPEAVKYIGLEPTGMTRADFELNFGPTFVDRVNEALTLTSRSRRPVLAGPYQSSLEGKGWAAIQSITLPLSTDGTAIDRILNVSMVEALV